MSGIALRACCVAFVAIVAELHLVAELDPGERGSGTVFIHLALTLLMFAIWRLQKRFGVSARGWVWGAAIAARLVAFTVPAYASHDLDRYLWDGAVALDGHDPYSVAAGSNELDSLRARWPTPEEHAPYPTLYPPLALALYAACATVGPVAAPWVWQILLLLASLAMLAPASALACRQGREDVFTFVALSPLLIFEGQVGAHLDVLVAAVFTWGLWALHRERSQVTALAWGLGAALKLLPVGPLGVWIVSRGRARGVAPALLAVLVFAAPYAMSLVFGWVPVGSLGVFFQKWRFGSPLWAGLEATLGAAMGPVALLGAATGAAYALWRARHRFDGALLLFAMALPLVVSPVVFPWYLAPLVPLLLVVRSVFLLGWVSALPLTYEVLNRFDIDGSWEPAGWPVALLALAMGLGLVFDLRSAAPAGAPSSGLGGSTR